MTAPDTITRLRKLLVEADVKLPWDANERSGCDSWKVVDASGYEAFDDGTAGDEYSPACDRPTRDLIVEAVNSLPALLDRLAQLERFIDDIGEYRVECGNCVNCGIEAECAKRFP